MAIKKASNTTVRQTVYDAQGNEFSVLPVDAREYLATGRYFTEKPAQKPAKTPKGESKTAAGPGKEKGDEK